MENRRRSGWTLAVALALIGASSLLWSSGTTARADVTVASPHATPSVAGPAGRIKHIVVIYQENHSFDETLGWFCHQRPGRCDGYVGPVTLADGTVVDMRPSPDIVPNVYHDEASQDTAIHDGKMDGWGNVFGCTAAFNYQCLTYYTNIKIRNLTALASKFVVSDRTFSMEDSPSFGGHIYVAAASQDGFTGELPVQTRGVPIAGPGWGCASHLVASWIDPKTREESMQPACIP